MVTSNRSWSPTPAAVSVVVSPRGRPLKVTVVPGPTDSSEDTRDLIVEIAVSPETCLDFAWSRGTVDI